MASKRMPLDKPAAWYRFWIGDFVATVVSDGELTFPSATGEFPEAPQDKLLKTLDREFLQNAPMVLQENCLVLATGDKLVLFDTGFGPVPMFGEDSGQLQKNMKAAGIKPRDIDVVILTHAHPDHCWGLVDASGKKVYPNAELFMSKRDFDFWTDEGKVDDEAAGTFVKGARKNILPYKNRLHFIEEDGEVLPGITAMWTPGHTVGHTTFIIESGGETFLNLGDICHHYALLFPNPRWEYLYDTDSKQAVRSRLKVFDMAETEKMTLLGYHFPFPGVGHITREKRQSYRYVPRHMSFV